jgi:hypothetical protein
MHVDLTIVRGCPRCDAQGACDDEEAETGGCPNCAGSGEIELDLDVEGWLDPGCAELRHEPDGSPGHPREPATFEVHSIQLDGEPWPDTLTQDEMERLIERALEDSEAQIEAWAEDRADAARDAREED